jgi:ABC-type uncharacterized transport system ATPase subunit
VSDLVLAACQGDAELAAALGGTAPSREVRSGPGASAEPVGAHLCSITVEGFRGIGPRTQLSLQPSHGLTVVVGRNGSGKSSFADALEVLLTGTAGRFQGASVLKEGWRNLHETAVARVRAEIAVEGSPGTTVVERTWLGDVLDDSVASVQVAGEKVTGLERLGWQRDIVTYRPFLAHAELESMFGRPSELHDRLAEVLGLEELVAARDRLRERRLGLEAAAKRSKAERQGLIDALATLDDERGRACLAELQARRPDFDAVQAVVTGTKPAASDDLEPLRRLAQLSLPTADLVAAATDGLRAAAQAIRDAATPSAERSRSLTDLLTRALAFHDAHQTETDCPVCRRPGALDDAWRLATQTQLQQLQEESSQAEAANRQSRAAVAELQSLVIPVPIGGGDDAAGINTIELAARWRAWLSVIADVSMDPASLDATADRIVEHFTVLLSVVDDIRVEAVRVLHERDDRWGPAAERIAGWLVDARARQDAEPAIADLRRAEMWFKDAEDEIRNDRLRPIADKAQVIWGELRHESNIDLGAIRLSGSATRRQVDLRVTVDGTHGAALGVMSQGEINALALSIFLPRATMEESPFRFVVIDDPVQAMDPAKVDGLARVLHLTAQERQVLVFSHDDRLPEAIRRLGIRATILQVRRRPSSIVEIAPLSDPASQALDDAMAVANDDKAPPLVVGRSVPGLCRIAVEAVCVEIVQRRELGTGRTSTEVDSHLREARTLTQKAALALFGDVARASEVLTRLNKLGSRYADTLKALNAGAHGELLRGTPRDTVHAARDLVAALRRTAA